MRNATDCRLWKAMLHLNPRAELTSRRRSSDYQKLVRIPETKSKVAAHLTLGVLAACVLSSLPTRLNRSAMKPARSWAWRSRPLGNLSKSPAAFSPQISGRITPVKSLRCTLLPWRKAASVMCIDWPKMQSRMSPKTGQQRSSLFEQSTENRILNCL